MRKLVVTLELDVEETDDATLSAEETTPSLNEYEAAEIADVLTALNKETSTELFAGSGIYAVFKECRVIASA